MCVGDQSYIKFSQTKCWVNSEGVEFKGCSTEPSEVEKLLIGSSNWSAFLGISMTWLA